MIEQNSHEMMKAKRIMDKIDPDDSEFVALALKLDASIWSHDRHFQAQDRIKIATSGDILKQSPELPALWETLKEDWSKKFSSVRKKYEQYPWFDAAISSLVAAASAF
jgi:predicted nucleic acid-binding protein